MMLWAAMNFHITETVALAAVALIGYLFGRRSRPAKDGQADQQLNQELTRASQIAKELQQIAGRIRQDVSSHQTNISQFKTRVNKLQSEASEDGWQELSAEAESLLTPTVKLATELSLAYDQLRKQSLQLMIFTGSRIDPQTGIHNRRAMEDQLDVLLTQYKENSSRFSLAMISLDCESTPQEHEQLLQDFVQQLESCARDTDVVSRFSSGEFVVLMPQTSLAGGIIFSERLLLRADELTGCIVTGGIVEVQAEDNAEKLLSRADSALYSARANGYNCLYQHNGKTIREHDYSKSTANQTAANHEVNCAEMETRPVQTEEKC